MYFEIMWLSNMSQIVNKNAVFFIKAKTLDRRGFFKTMWTKSKFDTTIIYIWSDLPSHRLDRTETFTNTQQIKIKKNKQKFKYST